MLENVARLWKPSNAHTLNHLFPIRLMGLMVPLYGVIVKILLRKFS
jgi:hypothetical protein